MKINSLKSLKLERKRLKLQISEYENLLQKDMEWIKGELRPVNTIAKGISKLFHSKGNDVLKEGIGIGTGMLAKNLLLSKSPWYIKLLLPIIIKNVSSNFIGDRKEFILEAVKKWIQKLKSKNHEDNGWYDSSTAQSHY